MIRFFSILFTAIVFWGCETSASHSVKISVDRPVVENIEATVHFTNLSPTDTVTQVTLNGNAVVYSLIEGGIKVEGVFNEPCNVKITTSGNIYETALSPIPLWLSIIPPLVAILLALIFREVITSLFLGILSGATIIFYYQGSNLFIAIGKGILSVVDTYLVAALYDKAHLSIIVFSMLIGAMVALVTLNGGMKGIVLVLSRYANSRFSGQLITFLMGMFIFFDDYANTLVVGNTMRPLTDKLKISREKLAYLVDSTSAPIAAIAFVTTWIGAELSYIESGLVHTQIKESAYHVFLNSLQYSFYPLFSLAFIVILIFTGRDYGPMRLAELKAAGHLPQSNDESTQNAIEGFDALPNVKPLWYNAIIPVLVLVLGTLAGLLYTGWDSMVWQNTQLSVGLRLSHIIGAADTYLALLWASLLSVLTAIGISILQRLITLNQAITGVTNGFKAMLGAIFVLVLAWCIAQITDQMHTADFITQFIGSTALSPYFVPAITFILSGLVSFSTGTSWGTMAIVYPLILPAVWGLSTQYGLSYELSETLFHQTVASVLAGAVLGDHISPISDTTILSSLASSCNHIKHVRTQIPYALTVGFVSVVIGYLPAATGMPSWILYIIGVLILGALIRWIGKKVK